MNGGIMFTLKTLAVSGCSLALVFAAGCSHESTVAPPATAAVQTTSTQAPAQAYRSSGLSVSSDIMAACNITFNNVDRAPKFDFDESALVGQDRDVLDQVAKCMTTGPLQGRSLKLIGRADPRGEVEYNFVLGEHRAGSVEAYLAQLGVDQSKMVETSRGKLDATGRDESGWQRDRRVDLVLL
jgi:peptidoglycan-associated lipoprotein